MQKRLDVRRLYTSMWQECWNDGLGEWVTIDGTTSVETVHEEIWKVVMPLVVEW